MTTRYLDGIGTSASLTVWLLLVISTLVKAALFGRPHIIFIMADDLGWNDVSFHGSDQIPTPNIDALAFNGVILNQHYVQPLCTPTRAALMTGRYPIHLGLQGQPLFAAESRALPPGKLLPEYLKEQGYVTRAIGKWHLGFYKREVLPIFRGFDSHMGIWNGFTSYYDYIHQEIYPDGPLQGFDLRRNLSAAWDLAGRYATDVFTDEAVRTIQNHDNSPQGPPLFLYLAHLAVHAGNRGKLLEAPQAVIDKFRHIQDPNRRTYAAMVAKLDESVGRVVQALQRRQMLEDSIIVFISDNGAPSRGKQPNWGSNYPFRGMKGTLWEGGVRGTGVIWSPLLQQTPRVSKQLMHITDWLPTLVTAAGGQYLPPDLDGFNLWDSLVYNLPSTRREILLNIDERGRNAAIRFHHWKLMIGNSKSTYDGFLGDSGSGTNNPQYNRTDVIVESLTGKAIVAASSSIYIRPTRPNQVPFLRSTATVLCPSNSTAEGCPAGEMCLYDLDTDPCETTNVASSHQGVARYLRSLLVNYRSTLAPQHPVVPDTARANPSRHNNTWSPWVYDGCALYDPSLDSFLNICDKSKRP